MFGNQLHNTNYCHVIIYIQKKKTLTTGIDNQEKS